MAGVSKAKLLLLIIAVSVILATNNHAFFMPTENSAVTGVIVQSVKTPHQSPKKEEVAKHVEEHQPAHESSSRNSVPSAVEADSSSTTTTSDDSRLGGEHVKNGTLRDPRAHTHCPQRINTALPTEREAVEEVIGGKLDDSTLTSFCAAHGEEPRLDPSSRPKVFYAIMFGYEFDMLEVALNEVYPVVDHIYITESTVTHSLKQKPLFFDKIKSPRYDRFLSKSTHMVFTPHKKFKSGWDIEKRQRSFFLNDLQKRSDVSPGDVIVANVDLDEVFSRTLLVRYKYCKTKNLHFDIYHFRYHLKCLMESSYSRYYTTVFNWPQQKSELRQIDLYKRRTHRKNFAIKSDDEQFSENLNKNGTLVWHMSAFGGLDAVFVKYMNSPHTHVGGLKKAEIAKNIAECIYQGEKRFPVEPQDVVPDFVKKNKCRFKSIGWYGPS